MRRFLNKEGFRVESAESGEAGLELARALRPDAITLDVVMPGMDGWALLSVLKSDPDVAGIPVIMVTIADDRNLGYALGAADYLTKPVDRDRLMGVMRRYDHGHQTRSALIVDDDALAREMLGRLLEREGWTVLEAESGRRALEQLEETRPSLILLDLAMPEMDGFMFVREAHKREEWRTIPIVVVTAQDLSLEDRLRLQGYVEHIVHKGDSDQEHLLNEVRDLVSAFVRKVSDVSG